MRLPSGSWASFQHPLDISRTQTDVARLNVLEMIGKGTWLMREVGIHFKDIVVLLFDTEVEPRDVRSPETLFAGTMKHLDTRVFGG